MNVKIVDDPVDEVMIEDGKIVALRRNGIDTKFDTLYSALGVRIRSELALSLGATHSPEGSLITDDHLRTSVDGLYAIGDVVEALNQISVAMGHAAIAAVDVHNSLSGRNMKPKALY